jgi:NADPH-dependent curcumin reductase CurA
MYQYLPLNVIIPEVLVEAQWITVDPYMRLSELGEKIGDCVLGGQVAK